MGLTDAILPQLGPVIQRNLAAEFDFAGNNLSFSPIDFQQFISASSNFLPSNYWDAFAGTLEENNESTRVLDFSCIANVTPSTTFSSTQSSSITPSLFFTSSTRLNSETSETNLLTSASGATVLSSSFLMATFGFITGVALMLVIMGSVYCYRKNRGPVNAERNSNELRPVNAESDAGENRSYANRDPSFFQNAPNLAAANSNSAIYARADETKKPEKQYDTPMKLEI